MQLSIVNQQCQPWPFHQVSVLWKRSWETGSFLRQFGIFYDETPRDSDESDLEVEYARNSVMMKTRLETCWMVYTVLELDGIYCSRNITHNKL